MMSAELSRYSQSVPAINQYHSGRTHYAELNQIRQNKRITDDAMFGQVSQSYIFCSDANAKTKRDVKSHGNVSDQVGLDLIISEEKAMQCPHILYRSDHS